MEEYKIEEWKKKKESDICVLAQMQNRGKEK